MQREYLEEDLRLIQKYFPGAKPVALRTPFDLTPRGGGRPVGQPSVEPDSFRAPNQNRWYGDLLWAE